MSQQRKLGLPLQGRCEEFWDGKKNGLRRNSGQKIRSSFSFLFLAFLTFPSINKLVSKKTEGKKNGYIFDVVKTYGRR